MQHSGLLLINKPKGISSRNAAAAALRAFPRRTKFGHVGTLDPDAWGVLPVLVGSATKCMDYLHSQTKVYEFSMCLGLATTTMDAAGEVVDHKPVPELSADVIESVRRRFLGKVMQTPPLYSAIKFRGRPLYDYARKGEADQLDLESFRRQVTIDSLEFKEKSENILSWRVRCSKGTYVRVLAYDLAQCLGTVAHVVDLGRIESSGFDIADAMDLAFAKDQPGEIPALLRPISQLPFVFPSWKSSESLVKPLSQGQRTFVSLDIFNQGLTRHVSLEIGCAQRVLLLKLNGEAFGIGNVTLTSDNKVEVHMKKGLI